MGPGPGRAVWPAQGKLEGRAQEWGTAICLWKEPQMANGGSISPMSGALQESKSQ